MYPRDYDKLLKLLGGSLPVRPANLDRVTFEEWDDVKPSPHRTWSAAEEDADRKAPGLKRAKNKTNNKAVGIADADVLSRQSTLGTEAQLMRSERPGKRPRLEEADMEEYMDEETEMAINGHKNKAEAEHNDNGTDKKVLKEVYIRPSIEYVASPEVATAPTSSEVALAFKGEGIAGDTNPFSPSVFDESRLAPPYRMLHDIEQPEDADVGGFAENLRWAVEQRAYYCGTRRVQGWNESSAHMKVIGQVRQTRVWASDELVAHASRLQEQEVEAERFEMRLGVR
jgi:hypothetical protein